jgi:hypothetical protein
MKKDKIKECIGECKFNLYVSLFLFFGFWFIFMFFLAFVISWWSIPIGIFMGLLVTITRGGDAYFTYQDSTTNVNVGQMTSSSSKLSYINLKIVGDSDEFGKMICKVESIDGKYIDGVTLKLPKSEIFVKKRYFWKQTFKAIG